MESIMQVAGCDVSKRPEVLGKVQCRRHCPPHLADGAIQTLSHPILLRLVWIGVFVNDALCPQPIAKGTFHVFTAPPVALHVLHLKACLSFPLVDHVRESARNIRLVLDNYNVR